MKLAEEKKYETTRKGVALWMARHWVWYYTKERKNEWFSLKPSQLHFKVTFFYVEKLSSILRASISSIYFSVEGVATKKMIRSDGANEIFILRKDTQKNNQFKK